MNVNDLFETPYLHDYALPYKPISVISMAAIRDAYDFLGHIKDHKLDVYRHKPGAGGIVAGRPAKDDFPMACIVSVQSIAPLPQLTNAIQVSMVRVGANEARQGLVQSVYALIASKFDLVSDYQQYLGAQGLWKAISKRIGTNTYVYDGRSKLKDYVRNSEGHIVKYNGSNIEDMNIWGQEDSYKKILLVATSKNLK